MNRHSLSISPLLLFVLVSLFVTPGILRAADPVRAPITASLQFTTGSKDLGPYTSVIPHTLSESLAMPIQIADSARWLVEIDFDDGTKQFHVNIIDPSAIGPVNPLQFFYADFAIVFGKPITLLKTTGGTLELTLTKE
jgi:hypothetical protein